MKPEIVPRQEFQQRMLQELTSKLRAAIADGSVEEITGTDFVQLKTSLDVIVTARKKKPKPDPDPEPPEEEPCCVCFRSGQGIVCSGECCIEVFLPSE